MTTGGPSTNLKLHDRFLEQFPPLTELPPGAKETSRQGLLVVQDDHKLPVDGFTKALGVTQPGVEGVRLDPPLVELGGHAGLVGVLLGAIQVLHPVREGRAADALVVVILG